MAEFLFNFVVLISFFRRIQIRLRQIHFGFFFSAEYRRY